MNVADNWIKSKLKSKFKAQKNTIISVGFVDYLK